MKFLVLALLLALAWGAEPRWAGVPLDQLARLGLGEAEVTEGQSAWQAPLASGGFVRLTWCVDERAAQEQLALQAQRSVSVAQPALVVAGADEALGDGLGLLIVRSRNVVILVRSQDDKALSVAQGLLSALQADTGTLPAGERDNFGRRAEDLSQR